MQAICVPVQASPSLILAYMLLNVWASLSLAATASGPTVAVAVGMEFITVGTSLWTVPVGIMRDFDELDEGTLDEADPDGVDSDEAVPDGVDGDEAVPEETVADDAGPDETDPLETGDDTLEMLVGTEFLVLENGLTVGIPD